MADPLLKGEFLCWLAWRGAERGYGPAGEFFWAQPSSHSHTGRFFAGPTKGHC
jgi:hypothetical protein